MEKTTLNEWWKTNFRETYLRVFGTHPLAQTEQEVRFILQHVPLKRESSILDIPCGQGRHSILLTQHGFSVVGVDYSPYLLTVAKRNVAPSKVRPRFVRGDMRSVKLHTRFDAVIMLGNSFGYFSDRDNEKTIQNISKHTKHGGYFVLDLSNVVGMMRTLQPEQITTKRMHKQGKGITIQERALFDPRSLTRTLSWTITQNSGEKEKLCARLRFYTFPEIENVLGRSGFSVTKTWGSFQGDEYSLESPRLIIIAQKRKEPF